MGKRATPRRPHSEQLEEIVRKRRSDGATAADRPYTAPPDMLPRIIRELIDGMGAEPTSAEDWRRLCIALAWHIELRLVPLNEARAKQRGNLARSRSKNAEAREARKAWNRLDIERAVTDMFQNPKMATWPNKTIAAHIYKLIEAAASGTPGEDVLFLKGGGVPGVPSERTVLNIIKPIAAKLRAANRV